MRGIFISYRREDSAPYAGRLYDVMVARFGQNRVFFDTDSISLGHDFREAIRQALSSCEIMLAVIGKQWATVRDQSGTFRLHGEADYVRSEISCALQSGLRVVPVLVDGAAMPEEGTLPPELRPLVYRAALDLSANHFHRDVQLLVDAIVASSTDKKSLFPLYGITLGRTTTDELPKLQVRRDAEHSCYVWKGLRFWSDEGIRFWYDPQSKIVNEMYLVNMEAGGFNLLPEPWRELGFRWQNSYDQWLALTKEIGYSLQVIKQPHIKRWTDHDSFYAEVSGKKQTPHPHQILLDFGYSRGTTTSSPATLYSIKIVAG